VRRIKKIFNHDNFVRLPGVGVSSDKPDFVAGMPRAGKILYLMRIALEPRKDAEGDRARNNKTCRASSYLATFNSKTDDVPFSEYSHDVTPEGLTFRANAYPYTLDKIAPDARRVVDKTPINFMFAGFIRLAFPQVRTINCVSDPMDTCFSCYKRYFIVGSRFAYSLKDLRRHCRLYTGMMEHWPTVMPGTVLDLVYEDMVGNFEPYAPPDRFCRTELGRCLPQVP
jgi:hypothetical protein